MGVEFGSAGVVGGSARQRDVQVFTASGTWVKPSGAALDPNATVRAVLVAGGAGGGSGRRVALGTNASGGGGGGGGPSIDYTLPASLTAASGAITIGAGGPGGASVTTDDTNGNPGTNGGTTHAGILASGQSLRAGFFANAGGGGQSPGNSTGGSAAIGHPNVSSGGAVGSAGAPGSPGGAAIQGGAGGGSGGGLTTGTSPQNGGAGGYHIIPQNASAGGIAPGGAGQTPPDATMGFPFMTAGGVIYRFGYGGSGGASDQAGPGGDGGNGQLYGGGGGGGGASRNGFPSGKGGDGAPGICIIITEWGG